MLPSWVTSGVMMAARATTVTPGVCATRLARMETRTASSGALHWTRCTATIAVYATMTLNWPAKTTPRTTALSCESEGDHLSFVQTKSLRTTYISRFYTSCCTVVREMFSSNYVGMIRFDHSPKSLDALHQLKLSISTVPISLSPGVQV